MGFHEESSIHMLQASKISASTINRQVEGRQVEGRQLRWLRRPYRMPPLGSVPAMTPWGGPGTRWRADVTRLAWEGLGTLLGDVSGDVSGETRPLIPSG